MDLYLQARIPGPDKEANWLPAPKGKFVPMLRLYWPTETPPTILDGQLEPPPAIKVARVVKLNAHRTITHQHKPNMRKLESKS